MEEKSFFKSKTLNIILKIILTIAEMIFCYISMFSVMLGSMALELCIPLQYISCAIIPLLLIPLVWFKNKKLVFKIWGVFLAVFVVAAGINIVINLYKESITIDTSPNINVDEYMPFDENSKIVTLDGEASLKLEENLPIVDGAAAVFPVYSAFVNAVYPENTKLYDGVFEYNNTVGGYMLLGEKKTDIFFGAYPSEEQIADAKKNGTEFEYTHIGYDAFVFFVHKDNPIDNLTTEQVQTIYSGKITNWKELGGANEKIAAFQRNEGSGSQSMLIRFMDGEPLMDAPSEMVNDLMSGIIDVVSDYQSKSGSIGFSFRYYLEGIIKNPDIKMLSIDGVAPTVENIRSGKYPITAQLYAVTYKGNDNPNVKLLLDWVTGEEGQEIIEKTGYVGIN